MFLCSIFGHVQLKIKLSTTRKNDGNIKKQKCWKTMKTIWIKFDWFLFNVGQPKSKKIKERQRQRENERVDQSVVVIVLTQFDGNSVFLSLSLASHFS